MNGAVLITGGGSGIGRAAAQRVARDGFAVAIVDRHGDNARETEALVTSAGGRAAAYECDVGDEDAVRTTVAQAITDLGRLRGVVTAAGIFHGPDLNPAHQVAVDDFVHVLRVNLVGTFAVIAQALPSLVDGGGSIVTIASTAAIRGHGYGAGYTASKGGVAALTPPARRAVRPTRCAGELRVSRRRRHADDRRDVRDPRSPGPRPDASAARALRPARRDR